MSTEKEIREEVEKIVDSIFDVNWSTYEFEESVTGAETFLRHSICEERLADDWNTVKNVFSICLAHQSRCSGPKRYVSHYAKEEFRKGLKNITEG